MTEESKVIIVGAGPVGLSLALCLARIGVASTIFERRDAPSSHPRAHGVNTRTMELFLQWGVAAEVTEGAYKADMMPWDMFSEAGGITTEQRETASPVTFTSCAQDLVEASIHRALSEYNHLSTIKWGHTCTGACNTEDGVVVEVEGPEGSYSVSGRWCVSAEGSKSQIRDILGVKMAGIPKIETVLNIHFHGMAFPEGITPPLGGQSLNAEMPGIFVSMDGKQRYVYHYPYDPETESAEDYDEERCMAIVRKGMNIPDSVELEFKSVRPWTMSAEVAESYRVGNIFFAGDAAHCFPPTGGIGMNTGIQDVHNLAWKFGAVLAGVGGEGLLDTYESERQPVAYFNAAQSYRNRAAVEFGNEDSSEEETRAHNAVIDKFGELASSSMYSTAEREADPERRGLLIMIEHAAPLGMDLGFAYEHSPVIVDDGRERPSMEVAFYTPNASPGSRAPHLKLVGESGERSLLELLEDGKFTLLTTSEGSKWTQAAVKCSSEYPLNSICVGEGEAYQALDESMTDLYGIQPTGAVLIRPDGHVSFRAEATSSDPEGDLEAALKTSYGVQ